MAVNVNISSRLIDLDTQRHYAMRDISKFLIAMRDISKSLIAMRDISKVIIAMSDIKSFGDPYVYFDGSNLKPKSAN